VTGGHKTQLQNGLITGHVYSITGYAEVSYTYFMIVQAIVWNIILGVFVPIFLYPELNMHKHV